MKHFKTAENQTLASLEKQNQQQQQPLLLMEETEIESKVSRKKMFYLSKTLRIVSLLIYEAIFSPKRKKQTRQIHFFVSKAKANTKTTICESMMKRRHEKRCYFLFEKCINTHTL